jgi:hypothetical protein
LKSTSSSTNPYNYFKIHSGGEEVEKKETRVVDIDLATFSSLIKVSLTSTLSSPLIPY